MKAQIIAWLWRVLVAFDRFVNVVFGGLPDETISARSATAKRQGKAWGCVLCRLLNLFQQDHCDKAIETDVSAAEKAQADEKQ